MNFGFRTMSIKKMTFTSLRIFELLIFRSKKLILLTDPIDV